VLKGVGSDQQRKPNAGQERRVHLVWPMGWSIFVKGGGKVQIFYRSPEVEGLISPRFEAREDLPNLFSSPNSDAPS
jgi:hypothetical protein